MQRSIEELPCGTVKIRPPIRFSASRIVILAGSNPFSISRDAAAKPAAPAPMIIKVVIIIVLLGKKIFSLKLGYLDDRCWDEPQNWERNRCNGSLISRSGSYDWLWQTFIWAFIYSLKSEKIDENKKICIPTRTHQFCDPTCVSLDSVINYLINLLLLFFFFENL